LIPRVSLLLLVLTGVPIVVLCSCCDRHRGASLPTLLFDFFFLCADFSRVSEHFKSQSKGGKKREKRNKTELLAEKPIDRKSFVDANNNPKHLWKKRGASLKIIERRTFVSALEIGWNRAGFFSFLFFISSVPEFAPIVR
jgi:hypothetical protein